jgi:enediyne biosynthesis protein E4
VRGSLAALLLASQIGLCGPPPGEEPRAPEIDGGPVEVEALPACEGSGPAGWEDLSGPSGLDFVHEHPAYDEVPDEIFQQLRSMGAGVAAADLDGDERPDLLLTSTLGPNELWRGLGDGGFERIDDTGLELPDVLTYAVAAADYDADGLLDVAVGGLDDLRLMRNLGGLLFEDVSAVAGIATGEGIPQGLAWADVDQDGDLDLFAGGFPYAVYPMMANPGNGWDHIFLQDDGLFVDHAGDVERDCSTDGAVTIGSWRDFDGDGDLDLLQLNDYGMFHNTELWENQGLDEEGRLVWRDRIPSSGIGILGAPMGSSLVDLDGDLLLDLWIGDRGDNRVFKGLGDFSFVDVGYTWGQNLPDEPGLTSWSARPIDLDGDGRPGVVVAYGPFEYVPDEEAYLPIQPNRYWEPAGDPAAGDFRFEEAPEVFPGDTTSISRAMAEADFDRDGVPDLVVGNLLAAPYVYRARCTAARRMVVTLRDETASNLFAVGAEVRVVAGDLVQSRTVAAGGQGTFSSSSTALFFGVGDRDVERVVVRWPDGESTEVLPGCSHCRIRVTRSP